MVYEVKSRKYIMTALTITYKFWFGSYMFRGIINIMFFFIWELKINEIPCHNKEPCCILGQISDYR